ncbi:MAG: rhomboid family intramembrane serine protease [Drouetiella hepatica Uher 2000/2452]|uniref:Rhomboid family intramembrane serine protease n=1 Tax=Drouetiella hepatica Uher 2000/2452 TaxID=904376 RepID=A0A951Q7A7_9CYAN|nr:rhomboid family intramembrane serine protease [Drouetiella hepatica Uher 2000/2452]
MLTLLRNYLETDQSNLSEQVRVLGNLSVFTWAIHTLDWAFRVGDDMTEAGNLGGFLGIRPREWTGLPGIVCAHFLHDLERRKGETDNSHIVGNSATFAILGLFLALQGLRFFYAVSIAVLLSSGVGTWLFGGKDTIHVGASGVIYGYMGFLMAYGFTSHNIGSLLIGFLTFILYSRSVVGIFPQDEKASWEMHLFGFLGGIFMALALTSLRPSF